LEYKSVVTAFLIADKKILLLKRSERVGTHKGKWAAVSGYLEGSEVPLYRAQIEIQEELGLSSEDISFVRAGEVLRVYDEQSKTVWVVHPFLFDTRSNTITLDWENAECRWIHPDELRSYETVPKLEETFDRVRYDFESAPEELIKVLTGVDAIAKDKVHGASTIGRSALQLLATATEISGTTTREEMFCNLLFAALKLRKAQPAMANVRNLVGMLLFSAARKNGSASAADYRKLIRSLVEQTTQRSSLASEDASRNAVSILPEAGHVLTHSYSSTVLRALELGMKSRKQFEVYAT